MSFKVFFETMKLKGPNGVRKLVPKRRTGHTKRSITCSSLTPRDHKRKIVRVGAETFPGWFINGDTLTEINW